MSNAVHLEHRKDGVAVVWMRNERSKNAMTPRFVSELLSALRQAAHSPATKVVVLAGLPEIFSSGASPDLLRAFSRGELAPTEISLPRALLDVPVPLVAAMEGHAIGGGLALGLCADLVVIARESRYGATFMDFGFTPGMGTTQLLFHVVSPALAFEMLLTGEPKKGASFVGASGFNAILPRAEVMPHALALAERVAEKPRLSLELLKRTLATPRRRAFEETYTTETLMHHATFGQQEVLLRIEEARRALP
jgi:polyketide biosynthesis enoyl-CoA hydratase PksI